MLVYALSVKIEVSSQLYFPPINFKACFYTELSDENFISRARNSKVFYVYCPEPFEGSQGELTDSAIGCVLDAIEELRMKTNWQYIWLIINSEPSRFCFHKDESPRWEVFDSSCSSWLTKGIV
jgi:hypothetical protein